MDKIEGLSPAISIDQKSTSRNPRSTVGTVTESMITCGCFLPMPAVLSVPTAETGKRQTADQIVDSLTALPEGTKLMILGPVVSGEKGNSIKKILEELRKEGYVRVRADGIVYSLADTIELDKNRKHSLEVVVDRVIIRDHMGSRLTDSVETALHLGEAL